MRLLAGKRDVMIGVVHNKIVSIDFEKSLEGSNKIDTDLIRVADIISI